MKSRSMLIILLLPVFFSCKKDKDKGPCYDCYADSAGTSYHEVVCTEGQPEDQLPSSNANGQLNWGCVPRP